DPDHRHDRHVPVPDGRAGHAFVAWHRRFRILGLAHSLFDFNLSTGDLRLDTPATARITGFYPHEIRRHDLPGAHQGSLRPLEKRAPDPAGLAGADRRPGRCLVDGAVLRPVLPD